MYYWVVDYMTSRDNRLRPVVVKGRYFTTPAAAQNFIDKAGLGPKAEVIPLHSSNMAAASQELKAILIQRYKSLDKGMTRAVHKVPGSNI